MEGYVYKWINFYKGWKPRYLSLSNGKIEIGNFKNDTTSKIYDIKAIRVDEEKDKKQFALDINFKKFYFKTNSIEEKTAWVNSIILAKSNESIEKKSSEGAEKPTPKDHYSKLLTSFHSLQSVAFDMNYALDSFHLFLQKNNKKKDKDLLKIYESFFKIKQDIRERIDDILKSLVEYNEKAIQSSDGQPDFLLRKPSKRSEIFYGAQSEIADPILRKDSESSFEECTELDFKENLIDLDQVRNLERKISIHKKGIQDDDFDVLNTYDSEPRTKLEHNIQSSNSMVSDMVKALLKNTKKLPVYYNEPLSMLQRQTERFQFVHLLNQAYYEEDISLRYAYIAAFALSEISLNINRLLKPFNPILGETYEYIDSSLGFRAFNEQVSHHPPVSAFIVETKNITIYGDSRNKHKFQFMKGCIEVTFNSPTHIIFQRESRLGTKPFKVKESEGGDIQENQVIGHYVLDKPKMFIKGLIYGDLVNDYSGVVKLRNLKDGEHHAELEFYEEGKKGKASGAVEGRIFKGDEILGVMKGSWKEGLDLFDKTGVNKIKEIWRLDKNEPFLNNPDPTKNYLLSNYAYNLNHLTDKLKGFIPITDSRFRPDQRELEKREIEKASEMKDYLEERQRKRMKEFEQKKEIYVPMYFEETVDDYGTCYTPIKDYWKDRNDRKFDKFPDIFGLQDSLN